MFLSFPLLLLCLHAHPFLCYPFLCLSCWSRPPDTSHLLLGRGLRFLCLSVPLSFYPSPPALLCSPLASPKLFFFAESHLLALLGFVPVLGSVLALPAAIALPRPAAVVLTLRRFFSDLAPLVLVSSSATHPAHDLNRAPVSKLHSSSNGSSFHGILPWHPSLTHCVHVLITSTHGVHNIRVFKINTRKINGDSEKKQLDRGALRGDSFNAIHNREAYSALCRKELRPDLFNSDDPCTVTTSDKFNMEHNRKLHESQSSFKHQWRSMKQTTMSRALLNHRVQELRNLHGQEWILATDGSFDSKTNDLAGWSLFVLSPSGMCWLFCEAAETERNMEGWHGEEDHTNNTGEMKAMLAAHVFIQHLQSIAGWQEARHEAPVQRLRDAQHEYEETRTV